jgi:membrane fusion protein (multidrug efflux system)
VKRIALVVVVVLAVVLVFALRFRSYEGQEISPGIEDIQAEQGVPVDAVTVHEDTLVVYRRISGRVTGWRQSTLTASMDTKVLETVVREGERVRRGQTLLRYDAETSPDLLAALRQAREAYENAARSVRRLEPLFEAGAVSESDLDQARTRAALAEADLLRARTELEETSPIDGVVTQLPVRSGDVVDSGQLVAQVASLDSVRVVADVSDRAAREVRAGAAARLAGSAQAGQMPERSGSRGLDPQGRGRIARVALGADPSSGLYRMEAVLENRNGRLLPGQMVTLEVEAYRSDRAPLVPRAALLGERDITPGSLQEAFVVEDGIARRVSFRVGPANEWNVAIQEGLVAGQVVVVFGMNRLEDGDRVQFHRLDGEKPSPGTSAPETEAVEKEAGS